MVYLRTIIGEIFRRIQQVNNIEFVSYLSIRDKDKLSQYSFDLTPEETKLYPMKYVYDITIKDETHNYTVVEPDIFHVKDSVKY